MDFFELVEQRHSVRGYRSDPVEPEKLRRILEAARLAPTAANRQEFRVIALPTAQRQAELKQVYGRDWFVEAPLVLAVCAIPGQSWVRSDGKNYSDVDAAIVMDHMVLAATALGLGTCWIGAFDAAAARRVFELEPGWEPVLLSPLGYARDNSFKKQRKSLEELVVYK
jgi:nitroreductase